MIDVTWTVPGCIPMQPTEKDRWTVLSIIPVDIREVQRGILIGLQQRGLLNFARHTILCVYWKRVSKSEKKTQS